MEVESNDLVYLLIFLLILFFISVCYFLVQSGLLAPVEIRAQRPPFGTLHIAYKFARGPYKNAGHLFTEAHTLVPELKTIGIYYDDPEQVNNSFPTLMPVVIVSNQIITHGNDSILLKNLQVNDPSELRYCVGVILSEGETKPDESIVKSYLAHGFKEAVLPPADHAIVTSFPFNNTVSIFIGVARVYPKLAEYIRVNIGLLEFCNTKIIQPTLICTGEQVVCSPNDRNL